MPSPTPWCSSYWKESLRVTLNYGRQLYLLLLNQHCRAYIFIFFKYRSEIFTHKYIIFIKLWNNNEHSCVYVCVSMCMYIYIYIHMDLCVWVSVYRWVTKEGNYLQHLWPASEYLQRPLCLFWHEDHKRAVPTWTCETGRKDKGCWKWHSKAVSQKFKPKTQSQLDGSKT